MNVFYNEKGIGNTLLINLKHVDREEKAFDKKGDAVRIFNEKTGETAGFNIFNISKYGNVNANGVVPVTEELVPFINRILDENGIEERVEYDPTPDFVVGYVVEKEKHPNADKLSICKVDIGTETLQIVCGAPNVDKDQKVVVATVGAVMPSGLVIKDANLRGVDSSGMICSAKELDLPDAPQEKGILVLTDDYEVGSAFTK
jgi:tRNA-binding protein